MASEKLEAKLFALPGGREFQESVDVLTIPELNGRISQMQKDLSESEEHKENNEELRSAREEVKELSGPYKDFKKAVEIKTKYLIEVIKNKGGA